MNIHVEASQQLYKDRLALVAAHTREVMTDWAEHKKLETKDRVLAHIQQNLEIADTKYDELRRQMEEEFHNLRVQIDTTRSPKTPLRSASSPMSPTLRNLTDKLRVDARQAGFRKVEQRLKEQEAKRILEHQKKIQELNQMRREQAKTKIQDCLDQLKDSWTLGVADLLSSHFNTLLYSLRLDAFDVFRISGESGLWEFQQQYVWNVDSSGLFDWITFESRHQSISGLYPAAEILKDEISEGFITENTLAQIRFDCLNDVFRRVSNDCHAKMFENCQEESTRRERLIIMESDLLKKSDDLSSSLESSGLFNEQHLAFISQAQAKKAAFIESLSRSRIEELEQRRSQSVADAESLLREAEQQMRQSLGDGLSEEFFEREKEIIRQEIIRRELELNEESNLIEKEDEEVKNKRLADLKIAQEERQRQRECRKKERELKEHETKLRSKLIEGAVFLKHGKKGKPHYRFVWVSSDFSKILWRDPSKTKVRDEMDVSQVTDVLIGQLTDVFKRRSGHAGRENLSFSIISGERTLDLEASSEEERDLWVDAFKYLVALIYPGFGGYNIVRDL
ncbi:hypothetical protein RCL1_001203 [Eukaryota sp. TZLM3-RCL]